MDVIGRVWREKWAEETKKDENQKKEKGEL